MPDKTAQTFLIVDSSADTCESVRAKFESLGYETYSARSTSEAIVVVRKHTPSVVILDLTVPGLPVAQFIKSTKEHSPNCKIILASGSLVLQERGVDLKTDGFIMKPYFVDQILELVKPN